MSITRQIFIFEKIKMDLIGDAEMINDVSLHLCTEKSIKLVLLMSDCPSCQSVYLYTVTVPSQNPIHKLFSNKAIVYGLSKL